MGRIKLFVSFLGLLTILFSTVVSAQSPTQLQNGVTQDGDDGDDAKRWTLSLIASSTVGLGAFVSGPQNNPYVDTTLVPMVFYSLADHLSIGAMTSLTWYHEPGYNTPLKKGQFLLSDTNITLTHARVYHHDDSGFNLAASLRVGLPTSLASQFQNRLFTLRPGIMASIPVGPVSFSYGFFFGKFFSTTSTSTIDCGDYANPDECLEGRKGNASLGYESERNGPEVVTAGTGVNSFYFQNNFTINWTIIPNLNLTGMVMIFNTFGVVSRPKDELSSHYAKAGRSQTDRLVTSLNLDYAFLNYFSVGANLQTSTVRPFGADGSSFVVFDTKRASDNITSLGLYVRATY